MDEYSEELMKIILQQIYDGVDSYCDVSEPVVYHYTSPEGLLNILQVGNESKKAKLWFTRYDSLNDTKEGQDIKEYLSEYCKRKTLRGKISELFAKEIDAFEPYDYALVTLPYKKSTTSEKNKENENVIEISCMSYDIYSCETYLCCFSREPDLLPMWNYYSKSQHYEGYNIGFRQEIFAEDQSWQKGYSIELKRVLYTNEEKDKILDKIILPFNKLYLESIDDRAEILKIVQGKINELQFIFKKECFKHEEEIRAILRIPKEPLSNGDKFLVKYRNSHGYIVPYVEYSIWKGAIAEVFIGSLLQKELAQKNISEMLQNYGYDNVRVESSNIPIRF